MIVDAHMHVIRYPEHYDRDKILGGRAEKGKAPPSEERLKLIYDYAPESYLREAEGVISKSILMPARFRGTYGWEVPNEYVAGLAAKYPDRFAYCVAVNPLEEGAAEEVERWVQKGAVGVGQLGPGYQEFYPNDERCFPVWKKCEDLGVPVTILSVASLVRTARLIMTDVRLLDEVAIRCPRLKIIIPHMGWYSYRDAILLALKHPNVFLDISNLLGLTGIDRRMVPAQLPVVQYPYFDWVEPLMIYFSQASSVPGMNKLIFASDWPTVGPVNLVREVTNINQRLRQFNMPELPEDAIHNILHENWKRAYSEKALFGSRTAQ